MSLLKRHTVLSIADLRSLGIAEGDEELLQGVIYDTDTSTHCKWPRRINIDAPDPRKGAGRDEEKYAPLSRLTVQLNKISMPEFRTRALANSWTFGFSETAVERAYPGPPPSRTSINDLLIAPEPFMIILPPHRLCTLSVSCIVLHRTASLASGHMSRLAEHVAGWSCASTGTIVSFNVSPQYFRRCLKPRQTI